MEKAKDYYERLRKQGWTNDITENEYPDYNQPFYQNIFRLMEGYAKLCESQKPTSENVEALGLFKVSPCNYEYELKITDEGTPFEINDWIPIATDRIKQPERIAEYLQKGILRHYKG